MPPTLRFKSIALSGKKWRFRPAELETAVEKFMTTYANTVVKALKKYPPPLADSKYRRTFTLKNSWRINITKPRSSMIVRISNDTQNGPNSGRKYATFVQGPGQTAIHMGRWTTVADEFDSVKFHKMLAKVVKKHIAR